MRFTTFLLTNNLGGKIQKLLGTTQHKSANAKDILISHARGLDVCRGKDRTIFAAAALPTLCAVVDCVCC